MSTEMNKREMIAAMAMGGALANPTGELPIDADPSDTPKVVAMFAVLCADALLAELERKP